MSGIVIGALGWKRTVITFCRRPADAIWPKKPTPPSSLVLATVIVRAEVDGWRRSGECEGADGDERRSDPLQGVLSRSWSRCPGGYRRRGRAAEVLREGGEYGVEQPRRRRSGPGRRRRAPSPPPRLPIASRALAVVQVARVERDRRDPRRPGRQRRSRSCSSTSSGERRDRVPRVALDLGRARPGGRARTRAARPVDEAERDARVRGVDERALALDEQELAAPLAPSTTSRSAAPARKSETTASTAIPQPAMAMPVCPVGTNTAASPRARASRSSSSETVIFPIAQSEPTVSTIGAGTSRFSPVGTLRSGRRPAQVAQLDAVPRRRARPARRRRRGTRAGRSRRRGPWRCRSSGARATRAGSGRPGSRRRRARSSGRSGARRRRSRRSACPRASPRPAWSRARATTGRAP